MLIIDDLQGDLPKDILNLPDLNLRVQFLNFTYLQQDYATGTAGSYVPLCQQYGLPVESRINCSEYFFEDGPLAGMYNTTISPDGLEYETTLVNGVEQPTMQLMKNQWYRARILYVPTRFRTLEPKFPDTCDVQFLAKDGLYMPETPRKVKSGFMTSGNRADFLIRCTEVGRGQEFRSLFEARNSSNWIGSQKRNSLNRVLAYFDVVGEVVLLEEGGFSNLGDDIAAFKPARPCYAADMMNIESDESAVLMLSGLLPNGAPLADDLPIERPACCSNTSYYDVNGLGPFNSDHRGDGSIDREFDFEYETGQIVDIDFYGSQIHPVHYHINKFQLLELPSMDSHSDYFQIGDFHDVLQITIGDFYGKAVLRMGIGGPVGHMLGHCHFYRHSDRGMAYIGNITGKEGFYSPQLTDQCYIGRTDRGTYELVDSETTKAPTTSAPVVSTTAPDEPDSPVSAAPITSSPVSMDPILVESPTLMKQPSATPSTFPTTRSPTSGATDIQMTSAATIVILSFASYLF